ncbi:MAG TPA: YfhO family protein [Clostridiales bacterium]|nr:YfhO family protein [Clostridiales bacterium]
MTATRLQLPQQKKQRYWLKAFLLGVSVSFLFFLPFLLYDNGLFLYYGDFNVQQISFYQMIHDSILNGNIGWSHTTDLGANMVGSYSFYLLGSPFFWLTLPFPSEAVPYLMAPLLILKTGCAALTAYIYLRRYVHNKNIAVIGAMLYAFSGFATYNIFFNHFHEAMVMFPLLLAAVDEYMETHRRGVLAMAVFGACLVNYYFFVGMAIFIVIYWFVRMFANSYKIKLKDFLILVFEVVLGFLGTAVLLIPSVLVVSQNNRVGNTLNGWAGLVYNNPQRYVHILESFFFPPDIPAYPNFTPDSNAKWGSVAGWLPVFSMTGVIAFMQTKNRKHWLKKLLPMLFLIAFVPILNSVFQLFNSQYYARWFYMLILMMCLTTVKSLEDIKVDWKRAVLWSTGITVAIAVGIGFMPNQKTDDAGVTTTSYGVMSYAGTFWAYVLIALISLGILILLLRLLKKDRKKFVKASICCICAVTVVYAVCFIALGKMRGYNSHDYLIPHVINQEDKINLPETDNVRSDFYGCMDNSAMFWQLPSIQAFHSIVPESIMEFYPTIGVQRDVGSRPEVSVYGLRSFTSTRWLFDYTGDSNSFVETDGKNKMPGWTLYDTQNDFNIYENQSYIPMGFTYDSYISEDDYNSCLESRRHLLLLKAMVLSDEQMEKYSDITQGKTDDFKSFVYTENEYYNDCQARKQLTCSSFAYDNDGFSAEITTDNTGDRLVFFSVPYEDGWSAQVNGEDVDIERVNVGFMAVRVPANTTSEIRFNYKTPGLTAGIIITVSCILIFASYMWIWGLRKNKEIKARKKTYRIGNRQTVSTIKAAEQDMDMIKAVNQEDKGNLDKNSTGDSDDEITRTPM